MKCVSKLCLALIALLSSCSPKPNNTDSAKKPDEEDKVTLTALGNRRIQKKAQQEECLIRIIRGRKILEESEEEITDVTLQENDVIEIEASNCYISLTISGFSENVILYSPSGQFSFQIPNAAKSKMYPTDIFSHKLSIHARIAASEEIKATRNLALNPFDILYKDEKLDDNNTDTTSRQAVTESPSIKNGSVGFYPHAYASRVTRNEPSFYPRNAIDGEEETEGHGDYPFQSWGYNQKEDASFTLYFGRKVHVSSLSLLLRRDKANNHDTYWDSVKVTFDDKESMTFEMEDIDDYQTLNLDKETESITISDIKAHKNNSQMYAALTEMQVQGEDIVTENPMAEKTYFQGTFGGKKQGSFKTDAYSYQEIKDNMDRFNNWFLDSCDNSSLVVPTYNDQRETVKVDSIDWKDSVYYSGLYDATITTGELEGYYLLRNISVRNNYTINKGNYTPHADHYQVGETYMGLNDMKPSDYKTESAKANAVHNLTRSGDTRTPNDQAGDRSRDWSHMGYWWCDAIYMGMNTFTILDRTEGDHDYVEKANDAYTYSKGNLYNEEYDLWHRDSTQLSLKANETDDDGNKIPAFWSRGNAWVFAALAKQLLYLDSEKYTDIYQSYKEDYLKMAESISRYQRDDGTWNASIVDGTYYGGKEVTGTSGYIYAYCIGLSLGILDPETYFPIVKKAYDGIINHCVIGNTDQLGYMQTVGYQPHNYRDENYSRLITNEFGMGLFLLASSSLMRICSDYKAPEINVPLDPQTQLL